MLVLGFFLAVLLGFGYFYISASAAPMTVLVSGVDGDGTRSDILILARIDPRTGSVALLSIPRDTKVKIPGWRHENKINASRNDGIETTVKTVERFLGVDVPNYVELNFKGFEKLVDILGGVDIDVEKDMKYRDPYQNLVIDLKKGRHRLNGNQALQYVRYRGETGDIGRIKQEQKFLRALAAEIKKPSNFPRLPKLALEARNHVKTNLSGEQLIALAKIAPKVDMEKIQAETVPGKDAVIDGAWYWIADVPATKKLVDSMFRGAR